MVEFYHLIYIYIELYIPVFWTCSNFFLMIFAKFVVEKLLRKSQKILTTNFLIMLLRTNALEKNLKLHYVIIQMKFPSDDKFQKKSIKK